MNLRSNSQRGQSMVEFAIAGPVFFLLFFAVIESALFINAQVSLDNATREGARIAGLCGSSTAAAVTYNGKSYAGKPPCIPAIDGTVRDHLGFLKTNPSPANPVVTECSPPAATGTCPTVAYNGAPLGAVVEVDVSYVYSYYMPGFLLGTLGPGGTAVVSTTIRSSARAVSQQ